MAPFGLATPMSVAALLFVAAACNTYGPDLLERREAETSAGGSAETSDTSASDTSPNGSSSTSDGGASSTSFDGEKEE